MEGIMRLKLYLVALWGVLIVGISPQCLANETGQCDFDVEQNVTQVSCFGGDDGAIELIVSNAVGEVNYNWIGLSVTGPTAGGLSASTYVVQVSDDNCTDVVTVQVPQADLIIVTPNSGSICEGESTNLISSVSGGTAPYRYSWTTLNGSSSCDSCVSHFIVPSETDTYYMTIYDANGCSANKTVVVTVKDRVDFSVTNTVPETCGHDGKLVVNAWGGSGDFRYSFSNSGLSTATFADTLTAGIKNVKVYDNSFQCDRIRNIEVADNKIDPDLQFDISAVTCPDSGNGTITVTPAPNTVSGYSLDNEQGPFLQIGEFENLPGGTHTIYTEDNNGCIHIETIDIFEPVAPNLYADALDITCFGADDGRIVCSVTNGTVPIDTYFIPGYGQNGTGVFNNLPPSPELIVYARDTNECVFADTVSITEPEEIVVDSVELHGTTCPDGEDGKIVVIVSGGAGYYDYSIGNGFQPTNEFDDLAAGNYTVIVRDSNNCTIIENYHLSEPEEWQINAQLDGASCNDGCDGKIVVIVSGGAGYYEYSIDGNNWQASNTFDDLCSDIYEIHVMDSSMCTTSEQFAVEEPDAITIIGDVSMQGNVGNIDVTLSGGTPPYEVEWSNGETSEDVTGLESGIYAVSVTDDKGCTNYQLFDLTFLTIGENDLGGENSIVVSPNPFNDKVMLQFSFEANKKITAYITDMVGRIVIQPIERELQDGSFIYSTDALPAGMYLVTVEVNNTRIVKKIVKK